MTRTNDFLISIFKVLFVFLLFITSSTTVFADDIMSDADDVIITEAEDNCDTVSTESEAKENYEESILTATQEKNEELLFDETTEDNSGAGWEYKASTKTLTLNGYEGSKLTLGAEGEKSDYNLVIKNKCKLNNGLVCNGNLNITGNGILYISSNSSNFRAIDVHGSITEDGPYLYIGNGANSGIFATEKFVMKSGIVNICTHNQSIHVNELEISGGSIKANSTGHYGVCAKTLTMSDGLLYAYNGTIRYNWGYASNLFAGVKSHKIALSGKARLISIGEPGIELQEMGATFDIYDDASVYVEGYNSTGDITARCSPSYFNYHSGNITAIIHGATHFGASRYYYPDSINLKYGNYLDDLKEDTVQITDHYSLGKDADGNSYMSSAVMVFEKGCSMDVGDTFSEEEYQKLPTNAEIEPGKSPEPSASPEPSEAPSMDPSPSEAPSESPEPSESPIPAGPFENEVISQLNKSKDIITKKSGTKVVPAIVDMNQAAEDTGLVATEYINGISKTYTLVSTSGTKEYTVTVNAGSKFTLNGEYNVESVIIGNQKYDYVAARQAVNNYVKTSYKKQNKAIVATYVTPKAGTKYADKFTVVLKGKDGSKITLKVENISFDKAEAKIKLYSVGQITSRTVSLKTVSQKINTSMVSAVWTSGKVVIPVGKGNAIKLGKAGKEYATVYVDAATGSVVVNPIQGMKGTVNLKAKVNGKSYTTKVIIVNK